MAKIKNLKRRTRCFNLEHPALVNSQGQNGLGKPETLTLLPLEAREVSDEVLECVEVRNALDPKAGRASLRIIG